MKIELRTNQVTMLAKRLGGVSSTIARRLSEEAHTIGFDYVRYVRTEKLSGQVLNRRSGWLTNHVTMRVDEVGGNIRLRGGVFGGVPYAAGHEYGFEGDVEVPAFTRKSGAHVGAYTRHMKLPVRSYLRSALADKHVEYAQRLGRAAIPLRKQS